MCILIDVLNWLSKQIHFMTLSINLNIFFGCEIDTSSEFRCRVREISFTNVHQRLECWIVIYPLMSHRVCVSGERNSNEILTSKLLHLKTVKVLDSIFSRCISDAQLFFFALSISLCIILFHIHPLYSFQLNYNHHTTWTNEFVLFVLGGKPDDITVVLATVAI